MSTSTPNLGLVKPDQGEQYDIGVFNANSDKLDAAVAARAPASHTHTTSQVTDFTTQVNSLITTAMANGAAVATGWYAGDGASTRTIGLPFTPRAVLVMRWGTWLVQTSSPYGAYGGLAVTGRNAAASDQGTTSERSDTSIIIETNGYRTGSQANVSGQSYHYIAIR